MSVEDEEIDLTEDDIGDIIDIIAKDGMYKRAEIVSVTCPLCGEEFLGTKRHAGGFIAGHQAYHEFESKSDLIMMSMGGD